MDAHSDSYSFNCLISLNDIVLLQIIRYYPGYNMAYLNVQKSIKEFNMSILDMICPNMIYNIVFLQ